MRPPITLLLALGACNGGGPPGGDDGCDAPQVFYADADADGHGDAGAALAACVQPTGAVSNNDDCDDADPDVHPSAPEACDGVDQDCDGDIDEDAVDGLQVYADADGDGFGDLGTSAMACEAGSGWVLDSGDCDDTDAAVNPDGEDVCGEVDGDCDGQIQTCDAGGVYFDDEVDALWTGAALDDHAGEVARVVGDIDGDGYEDAVVGAWGHDLSWRAEEGAAYVVYGGPAADAELAAGPIFTGSAQEDHLGYAVASAGDVDADGLDDLLLSAPRSDAGGTQDGGAVYLIAGDATRWTGRGEASDAALARFTLGEDWAEIGTALAPAGDTNDDGYADFLVGASHHEGDGDGRGAVWLLQSDGLGWDADVDLSAHPRWSGLDDADHLGKRGGLASGDFDGDGFSDLAVGAPDADATVGDDRAGAVYIIDGRAGLFPTTNTLQDASATILGERNDDDVAFGAAVAGVGDMDGDGFDDLLVGAPAHDAAEAVFEVGAVFLFRGGAASIGMTDASSADIVVEGTESWSWLGQQVAATGDMSGDGLPDAAIGAYGQDIADAEAPHTNGGAVFVLPGGMGDGAYTPSDLPLSVQGTTQDQYVGFGVSGGDMDGDGLSDLLMGAPGHDGRGAAMLFLGRAFEISGE